MKTFERNGISFLYPSNWHVDVEDGDDGWTVMLQSPKTAFVLVSLRPDAENAAQVADEALAALREEYPGLEVQNAIDTLADLPALGHDIDFLTLDTAISCQTRCIETAAGPLLLLLQSSDLDRAESEPVLYAIRESLEVSD